MYLPRFTYYRPQALPEAIKLLAETGQSCKIIAGGTDLMVALKQRRCSPEFLIDLSQLNNLNEIELCNDGRLKIGTMATLAQVAESTLVKSFSPLLAQAAWEVGSPLLRNRGTAGGNLFQDTRCRYYNQSANWRKGKAACIKMGGSICHINPTGKKCMSTYVGDLAPALLAEEAALEIVSKDRKEEVLIQDLFTGDGSRPFKYQARALATAIFLKSPAQGEIKSGTYWKFRSRPSIDFPIVGVAVSLITKERDAVITQKLKIGLTGLLSKPQIAVKTGEFLTNAGLTEENLAKAAEMIMEEGKVMDTNFYPASYRKQLLAQGLLEAVNRLVPKEDSANE